LVLVDLQHFLQMLILKGFTVSPHRPSTFGNYSHVSLHAIEVGESICEEIEVSLNIINERAFNSFQATCKVLVKL
jgi:hypothetical protein